MLIVDGDEMEDEMMTTNEQTQKAMEIAKWIQTDKPNEAEINDYCECLGVDEMELFVAEENLVAHNALVEVFSLPPMTNEN